MTSSQPAARRRRTQAERSAETRAKLVEATIGCLVDRGYAGTTTLAVCRRAGVSHGSLLHHFGRREALLGAALEAVHGRLREQVVAGLEALPEGEARSEALVELMWSAFGAPEFKAVLELWLAAKNQPELSWAVWPEARAFDAATPALARRLFPEAAARLPDFDVYVSLLFQALQGMGLANTTLPRDEPGARMRERVRALLTRILRDAFDGERGVGPVRRR
jgi:AcrR family transcriptional regulator